jgi:AcrR family transcriptional regulator
MIYHETPKIKNSKQSRAQIAVDNLLQSAEVLLDSGDPKALNARNLSDTSGYSIGTIYYYLSKVEDIFILLILRRRKKHFAKLVNMIEDFASDQPLKALLEKMVDASFVEYNRMNPRSFALIFKMIIKSTKSPLGFDQEMNMLVEPLMAAQKRDETNTFRAIAADDLLMLLQACFALIRRPFLEINPVAGTEQHRALTVDALERLLGNRP